MDCVDKGILMEVLVDYVIDLSEREEPLTAQEAKILQELLVMDTNSESEKRKNIIEMIRMGVDLTRTLVPLFVFVFLFQQGLEFEKDGIIASTTMREFMKNMSKLFKMN